MKLPKTSVIVTGLTGLTAAVLAWAQGAFHWTDVQTAAASGAALATIGLAGFLVEHVRKETASRWVGVLGMIPAEVAAIVTLGIVFGWWDASATKISGFVVALVTPLAALFGVSIAQGQVYSPETFQAAVDSAHQQGAASARDVVSDGSALPGAAAGG